VGRIRFPTLRVVSDAELLELAKGGVVGPYADWEVAYNAILEGRRDVAYVEPGQLGEVELLKSVEVPAEFVQDVGGEEAAREEVKRLTVVELVRKHVISAGKGAEMLGMNRWDFEALLAAHDVPSLDVSAEELDEDLARAREAFK